MDDEHEFGLVMPFVNVASLGGRYDDDAYCAGYEVGQIDARLEHERPTILTLPVHVANLEQLDLIAMRRGYALVIAEPEAVEGWAQITLTRNGADTAESRAS